MVNVFVQLKIIDGDREYTMRCLTAVEEEAVEWGVQEYARDFWGESFYDVYTQSWAAWGGEINISVSSYKILTDSEYEFLDELFYS